MRSTVLVMTTTDISAPRTLRPLRHLHWYRTAIGNIALVIPGATVGIVLGVQNGHPVPAAALVGIAILTAALVIVPAMNIRLVMDRDGVQSSWKGRAVDRRIARQDIRRAILRTVYNGDGVTTNQHLFLLNASGRAVLRMSDRWWSHDQLLAVAHHFDVSLETQEQPVQLAELRRAAPDELRWTERHRIAANALLVIGGFLLCLTFAAIAVAATR